MKKLSLILVLVLCFSFPVSYAAPSSWAENDVKQAQELNLTTERLLSDYQSNITREEFSEMIVLLYESISGKKAQTVSVNPFTDTKNTEILKAYNLGIVSGIGGGKFAPNDTITREQIAVMYYRMLKAIDPNVLKGTYPVDFADKTQINSWAYDAVGFMNAKEILGGVGNNRVNPKGTATREQAIALTIRTHKQFQDIGDAPGTPIDNSVKLTSEQIGKLASSVVKIHVMYHDGSFGTGSGFFYGKGKIATNFHVIESAKEIRIEYEDGSIYKGIIYVTGYSTEFELDLATLSVTDLNTPYLELDKLSKLTRGQKIYTIGSPYGLKNTMSDGLISAVRDNQIQITAPISPGSSGGVLLNEFGKVVGITTWTWYEGENLGFAIPINKLDAIVKAENLTLEEFYSKVDQKLSRPAYVVAVGNTPTSVLLLWENTGADYYIIYESVNGAEYYGILNSDGYNKWTWSEGFSVEITGYTEDIDVTYMVASVKNGILSEYTYSNLLTFGLPKTPAYANAIKSQYKSVLLQWENTGADYYMVYQSINGAEYEEILDSDGDNVWIWDKGYSIEVTGYSNEINIIYAVASMKNGEQSEFVYSKPISFN